VIPKSHPRYNSLKQRESVEEGVEKGITCLPGLIAQGRGECFDYLIGEKTLPSAMEAERVAAALLLAAEHPDISVNGNVAALCPREIVALAKETNSKIEANIFYGEQERRKRIADEMKKNGAREVLGAGPRFENIPNLESNRGLVDREGIWKADVVLVPLEDGDRTEALVKMGKAVITIDLNPLSRTSQTASLTIVDNITRALPNMIKFAKQKPSLEGFDNKELLSQALLHIRDRIDSLVKDL